MSREGEIDGGIPVEFGFLEKYTESLGMMTLALDSEARVSAVNRKALEVLGCERDDIIGKSWIENFLPESRRDEIRVVFLDILDGKIEHYEAHKTMHLRFKPGDGVATIEVAFAGDYFYRPDTGFDWAWQMLFFNGVKWRGKLPQLPLLQPEKSASRPF